MPNLLQLVPKLNVVENLPIKYDGVFPPTVCHGLVAIWAEVNNGKPPMPKADRTFKQRTFAVRPAMRNKINHVDQHFAPNGLADKANDASNSAHMCQELGRTEIPRDASQSRAAVFRLNRA